MLQATCEHSSCFDPSSRPTDTIDSGGSVLTQLQRSCDASIKSATYYVLVRSEQQADILRTHGFDPVLFTGLDDLERVEQLASEYDIVLNMAISCNSKAAEAFIHGLGERKEQGKEGTYIHVRAGSDLSHYD